MAARLIILWIVLALVSALGSWFWARRALRPVLWIRVAVATVILIACVVSYIQFGASMEKTFAGAAGYFLLWAGVYGLAAVSAGVVVGSLIVLLLVRPSPDSSFPDATGSGLRD
jgi:hypothetical protein